MDGETDPIETQEGAVGVEDPGEDESAEPLGAQILRRVHQDKSILMREYDEMVQLCEDDQVRSHMEEELQHLEASMTKIESLWQGHERYKELPELEGAMGEEEEEEYEEQPDEEEADSGEEELPPADEAVEGMETKDLDPEEVPGYEEFQGKPGSILQPHHREHVSGAHGFLGELVNTAQFTDEHRMKSYHHHKSLEGVCKDLMGGESGMDMDPEDYETKSKPGADLGSEEGQGKPGKPGKETDISEDVPGYEEFQHKPSSVADTLIGVSQFFKKLTSHKSFGQADREEAAHHQANLEPILEEQEEEIGLEEGDPEDPIEEEDEDVNLTEPGEVGKKSLSFEDSVRDLKEQNERQAREAATLAKKLQALASRI